MSLMSGFMGMPGMNMGVNPLVQLLNQNGLNPNWPAGLSGIFYSFNILKTLHNRNIIEAYVIIMFVILIGII